MKLNIALCCVALALASCTTPTVTPAPTVLNVGVDDLTEQLLLDAAGPYAAVQPGLTLQATTTAPEVVLTIEPVPGQFATPLGYITFTLIVHPTNALSLLPLTRAQALFSGQVTDWAQVPAGTGPVRTFSREPEATATRFIQQQLWQGALPKADTTIAPTWAAMVEAVGQTPGGIGYLPTFAVTDTVKPVAMDITLRALVVAQTATAPTGAAQAFIAWLQTPAGQAVVAQHYAPYK